MKEQPINAPCTDAEVRVMARRQANFLDAVQGERALQDQKWGKNVVPVDRMLVIMGEECGEVCRAVLEGDRANLLEELVQVAAVCSKLFELVEVHERRACFPPPPPPLG